MDKKDIEKILTKGSPKQRLLLIAEDIAREKYFQDRDRILTDREFTQLSDSFKKPNEIKLWHEFRKEDDTITNAIVSLQGLKFEVLMNYSNLRGYILVWNSIENAELLVNSVLHEIKDPQERRRIAEGGAKGIDLLFSKTEPDQEGYIEINVGFKKKKQKGKEINLLYLMNNVKIETEISIIKYLSWESAILDYMDDIAFDVKTYKHQIKQMTNEVYSPIIGRDKYSGELNTGISHTRMENIIKKYSICPNIEELKPNRTIYNWFRRYLLDGKGYQDKIRAEVNKNLSNE